MIRSILDREHRRRHYYAIANASEARLAHQRRRALIARDIERLKQLALASKPSVPIATTDH
jgi:hypothetical protein